MKKFLKNAMMLGIVAGLTWVMPACSDDDPDYENVTPPVIEVAAPVLAGVITTNGGVPVSGAAITLTGAGSFSAKTDANGAYSIADLKAGTYTVKAEAEGKTPQEGSVTLTAGQAATWSALLPIEMKKEVVVKKEEAATMTVTVPAVAETASKAPEVKVEVPANTFDKDVTLSLTFNNTTSAGTRAAKPLSLVTMTLDASDATVAFLKPVSFTIPVASAPSSVTLNGTALDTSYTGGNLTIAVTGLGTICLNYNITTSESTQTQALTFTPSSWDNLYGSSDMNATTASYTFQVGGTVNGSNTMLNNVLALDMMVAGVQSVTATYPLNVTVPVGTRISVGGTQTVRTVTYTCDSQTATITIYGEVKITTESINRQHNGGTN